MQGERVKTYRAKLNDQPAKEVLDALIPTIKWKAPRTHTLSQELIKVRSSWAADSIENNEQRECALLQCEHMRAHACVHACSVCVDSSVFVMQKSIHEASCS